MSNKVIGIEYTLKDAKTGEQLDTNVGQAPLEFVSGKGQIIQGLEDKLVKCLLMKKQMFWLSQKMVMVRI